MRAGQETANEYCKRVQKDSPYPAARQAAQDNLASYEALLVSFKARNVKTRRSLYDLMAGLLQVAGQYIWNDQKSVVTSGSDKFEFHIFQEVCDYRGREAPSGATRTGLRVQSHRRVQKTKWKNDVLKT